MRAAVADAFTSVVKLADSVVVKATVGDDAVLGGAR